MDEVIEQFVSAITDPDRASHTGLIAELFGAEYIGEGIDRCAYLLGDQVVKISLYGDHQTQLERWNYMNLTMEGHKRGEWAIPLMRFLETSAGLVSVCEYISGETLDHERRWDRDLNAFNVMDCHGANVIKSLDGTYYIIDLGYAHGYQECVVNGHTPINDYDCDHGCC